MRYRSDWGSGDRENGGEWGRITILGEIMGNNLKISAVDMTK